MGLKTYASLGLKPVQTHHGLVRNVPGRRSLPGLRVMSEGVVAKPFDSDSEHLDSWTPESWRSMSALQQPKYPDDKALKEVVGSIERMPPLVFAGEEGCHQFAYCGKLSWCRNRYEHHC